MRAPQPSGWGGGEGGALECSARGTPAPSEDPCLYVLLDAATCSSGKKLVGRALMLALKVRDFLVPWG